MAAPSDKSVLLHGDLHLTIIQARDLPNMDLFSERLRRCFAPCGLPLGPSPSLTRSVSHTHNIITSDPYVTVLLSSATVARTRVLPNDQNPVWNEYFLIPVAHRTTTLEFQVKDNDVLGAQLIGTATIPAHLLLSQILIQDWFPILGPSGRPPNPNSALLVSVSFRPPQIIAEDLGVPGTYFPVRKGGMVTLYQDAHVREGELPEIELDGGRMYRQRGCWEDICHAIIDAHRLIYIVGWSIYDKVRLVREAVLPKGVPDTLGELLKYKSEEGVRVCLLVWDDKTSHDKLFLKTRGVMQTHDEETRKFFKHSSVICAMSPRYGSNKLSIFKQQVVGTLFTHHQKCLLVDTPTSSNMRKITAFIGGLDLCDGRYDTPQHRLFRDLNTVFLNDIHNPTFPGGTKGPRQPWHDLHCKIEGPAAYDVLKNFEQRWRKATRHWAFKQGFKRVSHWRDDALIKLDRISWIVTPSAAVPPDDPSIRVSKDEDSENWNVQVFRSIDSGSVKGFPTLVHDAEAENLVCGKDVVIDKSIHTAYVKAIRSAQDFIYIENQYFIGSSYGWPSYKSADAGNLIPMELALKIVSKIRARERFAVYIVIPMWPEGLPTAAPTQEILFWQGQTMKMMYEIIGKELQSMNFENAHPRDYLNFYCLGNREELPKNVLQPMDLPSDKSTEVSSQKFRRFMVYVHAKGMIVDDEYVLLGSANINQRSLDGSRDTEIAMGAYQPHFTWAKKQRHPHGQVYGYRMSLWAEHLGSVDPRIKEPHTIECVSFVNQIAEDNWSRYTTDRVISLNGHLLKYPIKVDIDGKVTTLPGHETFPDVGGKVLGEHSTALPDELTM